MSPRNPSSRAASSGADGSSKNTSSPVDPSPLHRELSAPARSSFSPQSQLGSDGGRGGGLGGGGGLEMPAIREEEREGNGG